MICRGNSSEILILVAAYVVCVTAFGLMMGAVAGELHQAIIWSLFFAAAVGVLKFKGAKAFAGNNAQGIQPADT